MIQFNLKSKKEIIGSAKNAFSINFPFYVFALGVLLAFSAFQCEDDCQDGIENCEEPVYCGVDNCQIVNVTTVTVEAVICGVGVWDNLWFNDNSQVYLQPYLLNEDTKSEIEKIEIKDKMRLKVHFQYTQKDNRYDDIVTCDAYPGESNPIRVMAIEVISK